VESLPATAASSPASNPSRTSGRSSSRKLIKEVNPKLATKNLLPFKEAISKGQAKPIELFRKHAEFGRDILPKLISDCLRDGKTAIDATAKEVADLTRALHN